MIEKAVKYGKILILVVFVIILIYLVSISSLFDSESEEPIDNPFTGEYEFDVQLFEDDQILVEMTQGDSVENATLDIKHNIQLDPSHEKESETKEISIDGTGDFKVINTVSSESITQIEISQDEEVIYSESFASEDSEVEFQSGEGIQLQDLEDTTIKINDSLDRDALQIDSSNYVAGEQNVEYEWSMGDGTVYNQPRINHRYDKIGTYQVTLTVNADSYQNTESFKVTVEVQDAISSIVAPERAQIGEEVIFNGEESTTSQANQVEWYIDGERYTELNPEVSFDKRGTYQVTLTATSRSGNSQVERTSILVID